MYLVALFPKLLLFVSELKVKISVGEIDKICPRAKLLSRLNWLTEIKICITGYLHKRIFVFTNNCIYKNISEYSHIHKIMAKIISCYYIKYYANSISGSERVELHRHREQL